MPRAKVTTLYTLSRDQLAQWIDSTAKFSVINSALAEVADWAGVSTDEVDFDDDDLITVDGEPVAFLETRFVPVVHAAPSTFLMAAE